MKNAHELYIKAGFDTSELTEEGMDEPTTQPMVMSTEDKRANAYIGCPMNILDSPNIMADGITCSVSTWSEDIDEFPSYAFQQTYVHACVRNTYPCYHNLESIPVYTCHTTNGDVVYMVTHDMEYPKCFPDSVLVPTSQSIDAIGTDVVKYYRQNGPTPFNPLLFPGRTTVPSNFIVLLLLDRSHAYYSGGTTIQTVEKFVRFFAEADVHANIIFIDQRPASWAKRKTKPTGSAKMTDVTIKPTDTSGRMVGDAIITAINDAGKEHLNPYSGEAHVFILSCGLNAYDTRNGLANVLKEKGINAMLTRPSAHPSATTRLGYNTVSIAGGWISSVAERVEGSDLKGAVEIASKLRAAVHRVCENGEIIPDLFEASASAALAGAMGWPAYHKKLLKELGSQENVKKFLSERGRKIWDLYYDRLVEQKGSKEDADKFLSERGRKGWDSYYDGLVEQKGSKEDADNFLSERGALEGAKGWPAYHKKLLESLSSQEDADKFLSEGGRKRWVLYYDGLVKQKGSKEDADNFLSERAALNGAKGWPAYHKKLLESLSSEEEVKKFLSEKNRKQRDLYYDGLVEQKGSKEDADKFLSEGANACLAAQKKRKRENGKLDIALWTIQRPSKETEPLSFTYIGTFFYINEAQRYLSTTSNKQIWMEKQSVNAWNAANANPSSEHYFFNSGLEYVCKAVTENMLCSNAGHPQLQRTEYNDLRPKGLQAYIPMPSLDQMIKDGVNHVAVWIIRKPAKDDEPLSFDFQGIFTSPYKARNHLFPGDKTKGRTPLVTYFKTCRAKPTTYVRFIFLEIEYVLQVTHADATAVNLKQPRGYMAAPNI